MNIQQIIPADERHTHDQVTQRVLQGHTSEPAKAKRIAKDGRIIPVVLTASLLVDADGKPTGIATTEREIKDTPRL
jgi:PAS domain S-box-containing protein